MQPHDPILVPIKNGWHCGSPSLNITVRGSTKDEARALYDRAVQTAAEILSRPDPPSADPDRFANLS